MKLRGKTSESKRDCTVICWRKHSLLFALKYVVKFLLNCERKFTFKKGDILVSRDNISSLFFFCRQERMLSSVTAVFIKHLKQIRVCTVLRQKLYLLCTVLLHFYVTTAFSRVWRGLSCWFRYFWLLRKIPSAQQGCFVYLKRQILAVIFQRVFHKIC